MENNQLSNEILNKLNSFQEETKKQNEQINQRIDKLDDKLNLTREDLKELQGNVKTLAEKINGIEKSINEKIDGISKRIDNEEFFSRAVSSALLVAVISGIIKYFWFANF